MYWIGVKEMTENIFVTAVGGDIACAILRCIRDGYSCNTIIGCDISKHVQGIMYIDKFYLAPRYTIKDKYIEFIKKICIENMITHFLPTTEMEIIIAHKIREFFINHGIKLMINNQLLIEKATSKYSTSKYLLNNNILSPETFYLKEYKCQLGYPIIIKPDNGCGSKKIYKVNNEKEYYSMEDNDDNLVVQKYIGSSDEEYTVGVFSDGVITESIAFKRKLGFGGMSIFVEAIKDVEIDDISKKVADIFSLKGSINIQMRKDNGKYYIFEINPRISSTVGFRHKMGFCDLIWWLNMLDGKPTNTDFKLKPGVKGIKILDEMLFTED